MPRKAKQQLNGLKTNGGASEAPGLYQLYIRKRGTLSGGVVTGTPAEDETFLTNPTGNWSSYSIVTSGSLTLNQSRTSNTVNEYTAISPSGPTGYDSNGNMTTMPEVDVWATAQTLTYDAWNRPITVVQSGTTLGTYAYDGLNRRVTKISTESGSTVTRHFYYSNQWQVLEERTGSSTSADRQYIWGTRYVDDLILRDRLSGTVDRLYSLADYFQTTSIANTSGVIQERYVYRAFGDVAYWNSTWTTQSSSSAYAWTYLYGGYQLDPETNLYQVRNRYYHSALGRWINRDPLKNAELSQGSNLYWYVSNNAVNKVDSLGLDGTTVTDPKTGLQYCPINPNQSPGGPKGPPRLTLNSPSSPPLDPGNRVYQNDAVLVNNIKQISLDATYITATAVVTLEAYVSGAANQLLASITGAAAGGGNYIDENTAGAEDQIDVINNSLFGEKTATTISLITGASGILQSASNSFQNAANQSFQATNDLPINAGNYINSHPLH